VPANDSAKRLSTRYTAALTPPGTPRPHSGGLRRIALTIVILVAAVWAVYAYAQEAYLSHKLSQQVSDLRRQNALIAEQNQGYHKDIQALTSGAADEEEARLSGYSRPQERVYLVTSPPSPTPPPPSPSSKTSSPSPAP
jgi:cell division protein FtsB